MPLAEISKARKPDGGFAHVGVDSVEERILTHCDALHFLFLPRLLANNHRPRAAKSCRWRGFIAKTLEVLSAESARDAKQLGISHSRATSMAQALPCVGLRQLTGTEALDDHLLRGEIIWRRTCSTRKGNFMLRPVSHGFLLGFAIAPSLYLSWCRIQSIPCPFSSCRPRGVRSR